MTVVGAQPTLAGNFKGTGTFVCSGGTLTLSSYQWFCSTFTSTGTTATTISASSGGITAIGNSGTVINVTKTTAQLLFSGNKPLFTLTAAGTAANRGITWTGTTWTKYPSTMPGLKITNGSDTVTITQTAAQTYYNLESLNTTGFTGTLTYASAATYLYVYKDFVAPTGTYGNIGAIYLNGSGYSFATVLAIDVTLNAGSSYTQAGTISASNLNGPTGSLTLNNTGVISGGFGLTGVILVGDITFGKSTSLITIQLANITSLTSITKTGTSGETGYFSLYGTYGSSIPITFNGTGSNVRFVDATINGTATFSSASAINALVFFGPTTFFANSIVVTCNSVYFDSTINIPSASVFNLNATGTANYSAYSAADVTFTNRFTVNINATTTGTVYIYSDTTVVSDTVNAPDVYLTGSSAISLDSSAGGGFGATFSSLDTTSYTGGSISGQAYIANSLVQSPSYPAPFYVSVYQYTGSSSTFTLNSTSIAYFSNGVKTVNITSSTLAISSSFYATACTVNLNSCVITLGTAFDTFNVSGATVNAGTSTITSQATNSFLSFGSNNLYNVVVASGTTGISSPYVNSLTNSSQPVTVKFFTDVTFGTFGLNGTAGNLVTVQSNNTTPRTLTKSSSAWILGNSTDSGNNTGITFLGSGSGNNNYLNVSYITGVYTPAAGSTGNFFFMF
jgi:hypothetical protein